MNDRTPTCSIYPQACKHVCKLIVGQSCPFMSRQSHDSCLGTIHVSCLGTFHVLSCMFHVSSMALVCQALSPTPCVPAPLHANCPLLRTSRHSLHPTLHPNIYGYWHNHSCMQAHPLDTHSLSTALIGTRVGQNRMYSPYMTVCFVTFLPKIHRTYLKMYGSGQPYA